MMNDELQSSCLLFRVHHSSFIVSTGRLMKEQNKNYSQRAVEKSCERGVSIVELLLVVLMISIVSAFAVMRIGGAQRAMRLTNSAREFTGWLEKARLDSTRRHATTPVNAGDPDLRARVTIASANSYTVLIDLDGDGALDPPRSITIPSTHGATFVNIAIPTTIYYNWRGRSVDSAGNLFGPSFSLQDANNNVNLINLTGAGDVTLGNAANIATVTISTGINANANIKKNLVQ
jgi:Tfp pilus assembly protein FimT